MDNLTTKQRLTFDPKMWSKLAVCAAIIIIFWIVPPVAPITAIGMKVIGVFIGVVLMLSLVDTVWPAMLAIILLSRTGAATVNEVIAGSMGNWVIYFILMSFILTHALNESGFTDRIVAKFMGMKFVMRSPWTFTISVGVLGLLLGAFMDQVPATAFMLAFCGRVYKELGYTGKDTYPNICSIIAVYSVNIGGAMTPISHPLAMIGIAIYEGIVGEALSLFSYLAFGVPTGIILFIVFCVLMRLVAKPDMSKFKDFKIENVLKKQGPMDLREKITVTVFFLTVAVWMLPGILSMFIKAPWVSTFSSFGITFWAILSVVVMSLISVNGKPIVNAKEVVNKNINWGILMFISIGVYLGSVMSFESTGIVAAIQEFVVPITQQVPATITALILATAAVLMTNFASNTTTVTVMTTVGATLALGSGGALNVVGLSLVATMCGSCAYFLPSSFAPIAMLHADEYSNRNKILAFGAVMIVITSLVVGLLGYPIGSMLVGG
ncbi:anion permease [Ruminococcaceae bacterium OttesenSCG-928-D13]|nr:anion permease [Ruminococcaceae bacterium OttesenSCG-928-D13]